MKEHSWVQGSAPAKKTAHGYLVVEPDNERKWYVCTDCGAKMSCAAYGELPPRADIPVGGGAMPPRKINGWETMEQGMARCQVNPDCDAEKIRQVMES